MDEQQAEDWARLMNANDGVFGSVPQALDGRARSTSGSHAMRSGDMSPSPVAPRLGIHSSNSTMGLTTVTQTNDWPMPDNWATRLANCNETTEPAKVDECLSDTLAFLDRIAGNNVEEDVDEALVKCARLLAHFSWNIRARTYKLLRRLSSPRLLVKNTEFFELCLMRSLTLDDTCHEEREQAIKFARWTMQAEEDLWLVTAPVTKTLLAIAEQADDKMRNACLQTLCEMLVVSPRHVWYANGIRTLAQAALDGP
ncbi:hypothetical protein FBU59_003242, partial [Linderina macrospora]